MLTGFKRQVKEACQRKLEKKAAKEVEDQAPLAENAIVFTFTQPMRARPPPPVKIKSASEVVGTWKPKYESWEQEAFSRLFRRQSSRLDLVVREVHAMFACDWFYLESLYPILKKYNMMPRSTLPLVTCQYPLLEAALPETPWGFYFPYFESTMFEHGYMLYRLSPRFQLMLRSIQ